MGSGDALLTLLNQKSYGLSHSHFLSHIPTIYHTSFHMISHLQPVINVYLASNENMSPSVCGLLLYFL